MQSIFTNVYSQHESDAFGKMPLTIREDGSIYSKLNLRKIIDGTGDSIAFSDDAIKSIKGCSIPLSDLWNIFHSLATLILDLYINGNGDIFMQFRQKTGISASRGEGSMTHLDKKLMRQYETDYRGETVDIEAHITYPKIGQSIHFGFSEKDQKVIIGWCGEHKDNYTTKKRH